MPVVKHKQERHTLSYQLKQTIESRGLTAYAVGKLCSVNPIQVSRFLRGERDLYLATADRLAKGLGLRLVELAKPARRAAVKAGPAAFVDHGQVEPQPEPEA